MTIRQYIFENKCKRLSHRAAAFPDWEKVQSVMILYESDWQERNAEIKDLVTGLKAQHKQVVSWGFCHKDPIQSPVLLESRILGSKQLNILHAPKQDVLTDLSQHHFDLLIDLTLTPQLPLQYVALYANVDFKIGARDYYNLYDMIIPMPAEATQEYMFRQVMHYLQMIKSAD